MGEGAALQGSRHPQGVEAGQEGEESQATHSFCNVVAQHVPRVTACPSEPAAGEASPGDHQGS